MGGGFRRSADGRGAPLALAARVEEHVGDRGLSGFVARAVEHELERDALTGYLDGLDDEFGTVPDELIEHYDALWPS